MAEHDQERTSLKRDRLLKLANLAGSYLQAKKLRDILTSEISACRKEMEHLKDRGANASADLGRTLEAIAELESRVVASQRQLQEAQGDLKATEEENARLKSFERDMLEKRERLPVMRECISRLRKELRRETLRIQQVKGEYQEILARKAELEMETGDLQERRELLEQEILIIENTSSLLAGNMPVLFDPEVFQTLQGDLNINLDSYVSEVRTRVSALETEIAGLEEGLGGEAREREALTEKERELQGAIQELSPYASVQKDRKAVEDETAALEGERNRLREEMEVRERDLRELESSCGLIVQETERESRLSDDWNSRLEHLESLAKELAGIDDLPEELKRLEKRGLRLDTELEVNRRFFKIAGKIREDAEATNATMKQAVEEYQDVMDRLARVIGNLEEDARV